MREQLDFSRKGSGGFALILAGLLLHLVFFTLNLYTLALDVEAQAVEDRDVLIRDPDQGKEAENRAAPILICEPVVRDQQEDKGYPVAEAEFAGKQVEELAL